MKILFAVSLLAIIAAAALAFMTRSKLIEVRTEKDSTNKAILDIHAGVDKVNAVTETTWKTWHTTRVDAKDQEAQRKELERQTTEEEDAIKDLTKKIEDIIKKRDDMNAQIAAAIGKAGTTPEQAIEELNRLKGVTEALEKELDTLKKDMEVAQKAADIAAAESARRKAIQDAREKTISLSGRSSTILEVNDEFAFVRIGIGRRDGLTSDAKLLVKREGMLIANLKIVVLDNNQTIADIELKTVRPGARVLPGDQVIVETSVQ